LVPAPFGRSGPTLRAYFREDGALNLSGANPKLELVEEGDRVYIRLTLGAEVHTAATKLVDTELLGKAKCSGLAYENADGSRVVVEGDYFGKKRKLSTPFAGPFEDPGQGGLELEVW
jgi:alpha-N-arabinofuranosidase